MNYQFRFRIVTLITFRRDNKTQFKYILVLCILSMLCANTEMT